MRKTGYYAAMIALILGACGEKKEEEKNISTAPDTSVVVETDTVAAVDNEKLISAINMLRERFETQMTTVTPVEISTKDLREKTKQKWSKIHFYVVSNQVVRIKTYPYPEITSRTEEFYLENEKLALAVIEDKGNEKDEKTSITKMYYYNQGVYFYEKNNSQEKEYSIRNSEAEELAQEVLEYLDVFRSRKW